MCVGDWRIGRLFKSASFTFETLAALTPALPRNKQRVAVMFMSHEMQALGLGALVVRQNVTSVNLFSWNPTIPFALFFSIKEHGDLPMAEWRIDSDLGGDFIGITEWFAPESFLTEALESYKRDYPGQVGKGLF